MQDAISPLSGNIHTSDMRLLYRLPGSLGGLVPHVVLVPSLQLVSQLRLGKIVLNH